MIADRPSTPRNGSSGCSTRTPAGRTTRRRSAASKTSSRPRSTEAANKLGSSLQPTNEVELGKIRLELLNAGFRDENAVAVFFGLKILG